MSERDIVNIDIGAEVTIEDTHDEDVNGGNGTVDEDVNGDDGFSQGAKADISA